MRIIRLETVIGCILGAFHVTIIHDLKRELDRNLTYFYKSVKFLEVGSLFTVMDKLDKALVQLVLFSLLDGLIEVETGQMPDEVPH